jgi:hypothetical protein
MALQTNDPYIWFEKNPTSLNYILHLRINVAANRTLNTTPNFSPNSPNSSSYSLTYSLNNIQGAAGGPDGADSNLSNNGFDPGQHDKLIVNINSPNGSPLGKSTAHGTEADASGGGLDDMLRPFLDTFF